MKVLTIREPFATLIKTNKKHIETRSFKTNYRGYLYIHASILKIKKDKSLNKELMSLVSDDFSYGNIICKCKLVDCIYMTKEYILDIKKNNYQEYICGEYKEGRYAWVLDEIEPLKKEIPAKGQLGIWNFYEPNEVMNKLNEIKYGFLDKNNNVNLNINDNFQNNYILQTPKEVIKNKVGVCWDQVELERYYFNNYNIKTFFIVAHFKNIDPTHTFLTFYKNNKYYWFEHSWKKYQGIYEYNDLNDLLIDVKNKFIDDLESKSFESLFIYEYKKPKSHINVEDFFIHCENGILIDTCKKS